MRQGVANLPLHYGAAPRWLFARMTRLARAITEIIVRDFGPEEFLLRMSDPFWFQSFGCVLGFDWHSSGLTTTLCGAVKEGIKGLEKDLGLIVAGGKGATSRKTPAELTEKSELFALDPTPYIYASRMSAKVDSAALQDGYQIYHHVFLLTGSGKWAVVQQGMNTDTRWARRYHWLGDRVSDFVNEPHSAISCDHKASVLNMVAEESGSARQVSAQLAGEKPWKNILELKRLKELSLPEHHPVFTSDIQPDRMEKTLLKAYENPPQDFKALLMTPGVGPKTIRALAMIAELTYGAAPSFRDPVSYSFAHGGKDGFPYPINRAHYDQSIAIMEQSIRAAKVGENDKTEALRRLGRWSAEQGQESTKAKTMNQVPRSNEDAPRRLGQ
jgi:hypothetical protein